MICSFSFIILVFNLACSCSGALCSFLALFISLFALRFIYLYLCAIKLTMVSCLIIYSSSSLGNAKLAKQEWRGYEKDLRLRAFVIMVLFVLIALLFLVGCNVVMVVRLVGLRCCSVNAIFLVSLIISRSPSRLFRVRIELGECCGGLEGGLSCVSS